MDCVFPTTARITVVVDLPNENEVETVTRDAGCANKGCPHAKKVTTTTHEENADRRMYGRNNPICAKHNPLVVWWWKVTASVVIVMMRMRKKTLRSKKTKSPIMYGAKSRRLRLDSVSVRPVVVVLVVVARVVVVSVGQEWSRIVHVTVPCVICPPAMVSWTIVAMAERA